MMKNLLIYEFVGFLTIRNIFEYSDFKKNYHFVFLLINRNNCNFIYIKFKLSNNNS